MGVKCEWFFGFLNDVLSRRRGEGGGGGDVTLISRAVPPLVMIRLLWKRQDKQFSEYTRSADAGRLKMKCLWFSNEWREYGSQVCGGKDFWQRHRLSRVGTEELLALQLFGGAIVCVTLSSSAHRETSRLNWTFTLVLTSDLG